MTAFHRPSQPKRIWPLPVVEYLAWSELDEQRPVTLVTTSSAWEAIKDRLKLKVSWHVEVTDSTLDHWRIVFDRTLAPWGGNPMPQAIYSVGGGLAVDAAKHLAVLTGWPLICLPTVLSTDAFFTWVSGHRQAGCVQYKETRPPERVVIDLKVIAKAPPSIRTAGFADVLSIATGSWDWKFAHENKLNPPEMEFSPWVYRTARSILVGAFECAEAAGRGDPAGLRQLVTCLALEVQLCNQIGHVRPQEGSEHYFAYSVENLVGNSHTHGELVGRGVLIMAELQGQDVPKFKQSLDHYHIPCDTLPSQIIEQTLAGLGRYARQHNLPYGIAHTL
jgi:glycerol-1-phosphate dehydrogenase [NAD(P)+]